MMNWNEGVIFQLGLLLRGFGIFNTLIYKFLCRL